MDVFYKQLAKPMKNYIIPFELKRAFDPCQPIYINGPAYTVYSKNYRGLIRNVDTVYGDLITIDTTTHAL
jgi:hypothetical protein